jgi:hypothetical protein
MIKMENSQHPTFNIERRGVAGLRGLKRRTLNVQGSRFKVLLFLLLLASLLSRAQTPPQIAPGSLMQLQVAQPAVDISSPVTATATFDPPVTQVGGKTFYRVTVDATESSIEWPEKIPAPLFLLPGIKSQGQIMQTLNGQFRPLTAFLYEVLPTTTGRFTIPEFKVPAYGQTVTIPAASLDVVAENSAPIPPPRQLVLETSATNVFLGEPFRVRVLLPSSAANEIEALRETLLNGDGFITDKTATRQSVQTINYQGQLKPVFLFETTLTPIATGPLRISAQAFTAGREFSGQISITGQVTIPGGPARYVFLVSEPVEIKVRPLPSAGELPGFTGTIGKFTIAPPRLATNRFRVGEPVHLEVGFHAEGNLTRFVPPEPPRVREWQIIADKPPGSGYTLIALTDEVRATPAIPFSYFDPEAAQYVDLTIPALPVTVTGQGLPVEVTALNEAETNALLKLSNLATTADKTVSSLKPLQLQRWFIGVQLVPLIGFIALWQWDRRRRFLAAHPEIVRRRKAKRDLRREKIKLQKAVAAGDAAAFTQHAVNAMKIAVAPHFPAHPQALVGGDVLWLLDAAGRDGETVRAMFAADDSQFAITPTTQADLLSLHSAVEAVLQKLEARL